MKILIIYFYFNRFENILICTHKLLNLCLHYLKERLTVLLPKFFTRHVNLTVLPTRPVIFEGTVVSNVGPPVPGVGKSCKKSVKKRFEAHSKEPERKLKIFSIII